MLLKWLFPWYDICHMGQGVPTLLPLGPSALKSRILLYHYILVSIWWCQPCKIMRLRKPLGALPMPHFAPSYGCYYQGWRSPHCHPIVKKILKGITIPANMIYDLMLDKSILNTFILIKLVGYALKEAVTIVLHLHYTWSSGKSCPPELIRVMQLGYQIKVLFHGRGYLVHLSLLATLACLATLVPTSCSLSPISGGPHVP
jgi:hypothetical protein